MKPIDSAFSAFLFTLKKFSCLLILIILPLCFLWQIDSMLLSSNITRIIVDTAFMVVFFFLLALLGALIAGFIYLSGSFFFKKEVLTKIIAVYSVLALAVAGAEFASSFRLWVSKFFGVGTAMPLFVNLIIIILCLGVFVLFNNRIMQIFDRETNRFFKAVLIMIALSIGGIIIRIAFAGQGKQADTAISIAPGIDQNNHPNVILITFDALTAEDMSLYGYELKTTPNMDLFANESYVFSDMYANSNWTRSSVASILTGTYPSTHKLINTGIMNCFLPDSLKGKNIAAILKNNGYQTAAIVNNSFFAHPSRNGIANDFDYAPLNRVSKLRAMDYLLEPLGPFFCRIESGANLWMSSVVSTSIITAILNKIKSRSAEKKQLDARIPRPRELTFDRAWNYMQKAKSPFFLWIHVFAPHMPYLPGDPFIKQFLREDVLLSSTQQQALIQKARPSYTKELQKEIDKLRLRYDENILYADHEFGIFLDKLRHGGFLDTSIVVVSADHGESFNHGFIEHTGPSLNNDLIHIPLIIHAPKQKQRKDISYPVEQVDIAPTILDLLGICISPWVEGESVKKAIDHPIIGNKAIFSMQLKGNNIQDSLKKGTIAVIHENYKYLYYFNDKKEELYSLADDPDESSNLAEVEQQRVNIMRKLIINKILKDLKGDRANKLYPSFKNGASNLR